MGRAVGWEAERAVRHEAGPAAGSGMAEIDSGPEIVAGFALESVVVEPVLELVGEVAYELVVVGSAPALANLC